MQLQPRARDRRRRSAGPQDASSSRSGRPTTCARRRSAASTPASRPSSLPALLGAILSLITGEARLDRADRRLPADGRRPRHRRLLVAAQVPAALDDRSCSRLAEFGLLYVLANVLRARTCRPLEAIVFYWVSWILAIAHQDRAAADLLAHLPRVGVRVPQHRVVGPARAGGPAGACLGRGGPGRSRPGRARGLGCACRAARAPAASVGCPRRSRRSVEPERV